MKKYAGALSCTVCQNVFLGGESYQVTTYCGKENLVCLQCVPNLRRCESCDRPGSVRLQLRRVLSDERSVGKVRYQCQDCDKAAVKRLAEGRQKMVECMLFLESHLGLSFATKDIPIVFTDYIGNGKSVKCSMGGTCLFVGDGQCSTRVVRKPCEAEWYEHTREVVNIHVLPSLHEVYLGRTLCHELVHCWFALNMGNPCIDYETNSEDVCRICPTGTLEEETCEGLCETAAFLYLQHRTDSCPDNSPHTLSCIATALKVLKNNRVETYKRGLDKVQGALKTFVKRNGGRRGKLEPNTIRSFFVHVVLHGSLPTRHADMHHLSQNNMYCPCDVCGRSVRPTDAHKFSFVVNGLRVVHVDCFRDKIALRCSHCNGLLLDESVVTGQRLHERCFLAKENDTGEKCGRCNKPLWEQEPPSSKNNNRGSFVRRTSRTSTGELVHHACGDKCKFCNAYLADFPAIGKQMLHKKCFLAYHRRAGDMCGLCGETLWATVKETGGFTRKTMQHNGAEVHCSCLRCKVCKESMESSPAMSSEMCHMKCFIQLTEMRGETCNVCKESLWRTNGKSFTRNGIKDLAGNIVHRECGPTCAHCNNPLFTEPFLKASDSSALCVHSNCFIDFHTHRGDKCGICRKSLWERSADGKGFGRRTSYSEEHGDIHAKCLGVDNHSTGGGYYRK